MGDGQNCAGIKVGGPKRNTRITSLAFGEEEFLRDVLVDHHFTEPLPLSKQNGEPRVRENAICDRGCYFPERLVWARGTAF
jgi:hypothetical protein